VGAQDEAGPIGEEQHQEGEALIDDRDAAANGVLVTSEASNPDSLSPAAQMIFDILIESH